LRVLELDAERYRQQPALDGAQLWIVDPHGNLVLRYAAGSDGKRILDDLRHLLKSSQIG
jgi:cytochrome oxidase Cu insertion factor (SCO1/SenC/PrrC family)